MNYHIAKQRNKQPRFDWKSLLGRPLRDWCYMQFSAGATAKYCIAEIHRRLENYYENKMWLNGKGCSVTLHRAKQNAKIGVTAAKSEYKRVRERWHGT